MFRLTCQQKPQKLSLVPATCKNWQCTLSHWGTRLKEQPLTGPVLTPRPAGSTRSVCCPDLRSKSKAAVGYSIGSARILLLQQDRDKASWLLQPGRKTDFTSSPCRWRRGRQHRCSPANPSKPYSSTTPLATRMLTPARSEKDMWPLALRYQPLSAAAFASCSRSFFACGRVQLLLPGRKRLYPGM